MEIIFLGTGTSSGIPVIGCGCRVCQSPDSRDIRLRSSALIKHRGQTILIDITPEFRLQALQCGLKKLDALLLTHAHADHLHGLDDLRPLTHEAPLPLWANAEACRDLKERFSYLFRETQKGGGKARLEVHCQDRGSLSLPGNIPAEILPGLHGEIPVSGYLLDKKLAYVTDCSYMPEEVIQKLKNVPLLVLGALRFRPHSTHMSIDQAMAHIEQIRPQQARLIHMCHEVSHQEILTYLEQHYGHLKTKPARDGLRIKL